MISFKKKSFKRIWKAIIISFFSFIIISLMLTKVIYDFTFSRYDEAAVIPESLSEFIDKRQELTFKSGKNSLCGYFYEGNSKSLIVLVTGYKAVADDYIWQIKELTDLGYGIFTFDTTGYLKSEGKDSVGFAQTVYDLKSALEFLEKNNRFGYEDIYLLGHSRGAYAVLSVLDDGYDIKAAVSVSGVNSSMEAIIQPAADKVGFIAYLNYPFLWLYQRALFDKETLNTRADENISKSDIPVLVVQGENDDTYPKEKYSVFSHIGGENKNVTLLVMDKEGSDGHTNLLFEADGTANNGLLENIDSFLKTRGK